MDFSRALMVAGRENIKVETLLRLAQNELHNFQGEQKVRLAEAILSNSDVIGDDTEVEYAVMQELFVKGGIESFSTDDIIYILPNIIHCGEEDLFIKYMKMRDDFEESEWYTLCERYSLLEIELSPEYGRKPKLLSEKWNPYVFFENKDEE